MSDRGKVLLGAVRRNFDLLREHEKVSIDEVELIVRAIVAHVRSWKPTAITAIPERPDA